MSIGKKESFFWTSYTDLMTSLFFVMLTLFVLVIVVLNNKMQENIKLLKENEILIARLDSMLKATQEQLNKIKEIEESVKNISTDFFQYDSNYKRHTLKGIEIEFETYSADISDIKQKQLNKLRDAGYEIKQFVNRTVSKYPEVKYLLVIEGQSSRDNYRENYELSYKRALALVKYWEKEGISFNDEHCEIIISGSGQESRFRLKPDIAGNKSNQRFVIHIIPKPGVIENNNNTSNINRQKNNRL